MAGEAGDGVGQLGGECVGIEGTEVADAAIGEEANAADRRVDEVVRGGEEGAVAACREDEVELVEARGEPGAGNARGTGKEARQAGQGVAEGRRGGTVFVTVWKDKGQAWIIRHRGVSPDGGGRRWRARRVCMPKC